MATPVPTNHQALTAQVKKLINTQLKQVLKGSGLPVSGAKAALQTRIIARLEDCLLQNDLNAYDRLKLLCYNPDADPYGPSPSPSTARPLTTPSLQPQNQAPYLNPFGSGPLRPGPMPSLTNGTGPKSPMFKPSPFFTIIEPLTPVLECKATVRETTRDTVQTTINLRNDTADRLNQNPTIKAMIYCAGDTLASPFTRVDIAFPYQVEIKVNQDEVKSNLLRGLKNKPGSTRPADITSLLRKRAGYENHLVVTYALTQKRFFILVNLVRQHPVEELVARLKNGKTIPKERVIREMISKAEDSDIVATSSIMSLKCPLSTLRIDVPCRSTLCSHNQCFDATSFLQLQEQAPTWTCPVCNKPVSFEQLEVDQYVDEVLRSTPRAVDQVTIEPNGKWSTTAGVKPSPRSKERRQSSSSDGEDLVEIQEQSSLTSIKRETNREGDIVSTPSLSSREPSTALAFGASSGSKRPASQVVDLTFSSDEDDEPVRAPKRQNTRPTSNGLSTLPATENMPVRPNGNPAPPKQTTYPSTNPFLASNYQPRQYGELS